MNLGRSFFSLYFLIIACFGGLNWILDELWSIQVEQKIESYTGYKTLLKAFEINLASFPQAQWQSRIDLQKERYELPLLLVDADNVETLIPDLKFVKSEETTVYYDNDQIFLFRPISNHDLVLVLGPVQSPTRPRTEALIRVFIVLVLGIVIFFWVWPISKDLDQLNDTVHKFGQGDFNAKVSGGNSVLVRPMMNTFNMMAARINGLIEAHKELTNAVSHELRTPLSRSKFSLELLRQAKDENTRQIYLNKISSDIEELESLVNELLVYAAFENEQPNIQLNPTNISTLVKAQVESFSNFSGEINFIDNKSDIFAKCDEYFINRAVSNLIANAIKYGHGKVVVSVSEQNDQCLIVVEDNGIGISPAFKDVIFAPFSRDDESRTRETGGFGLGLAIVNKIMQWHKGQVVIEDSELGGAKFILSLPKKHNQHLV
ncbi:ATP-binding protein [Thalassotalea aquiviva]|uniref:ATP-binding protein n=1 Tax=Thalassotalea aquiviva TaxID=3242415 RepID=UPI00352BB6E4